MLLGELFLVLNFQFGYLHLFGENYIVTRHLLFCVSLPLEHKGVASVYFAFAMLNPVPAHATQALCPGLVQHHSINCVRTFE